MPIPAPAPGAAATPSTGSPTTPTSGWPGAAPDGAPHLVPLSFDWDGETLLMATPAGQPERRQPRRDRARSALGLGPHPRRER